MGLIGCYSLDLYCDHPDCTYKPHTFTGRTESECIRGARRAGWVIDKKGEGREGSGLSICPQHRTRARRRAALTPSPSPAR